MLAASPGRDPRQAAPTGPTAPLKYVTEYDPFADTLTVATIQPGVAPHRVATIQQASAFAGGDAPGADWPEPVASLLTGWAAGFRARGQRNVAAAL